MNPEEIPVRQKNANGKETHDMEGNGTAGMIKILTQFQEYCFKWKTCIYINVTNANIVK